MSYGQTLPCFSPCFEMSRIAKVKQDQNLALNSLFFLQDFHLISVFRNQPTKQATLPHNLTMQNRATTCPSKINRLITL